MRHRRCKSAAPRRPAGFTLVEVLMVLTIISLLAGLIGVGVRGAVRRGREATVSTEISQLNNAMNDFKSKYGAFPPSLGTPLEGTTTGPASPLYTSETEVQRQTRILRFLARAFPRYVPSATYTVASYPAYYLPDYIQLKVQIGLATVAYPVFTAAPFSGDGALVYSGALQNCCNIDTLDPAEAMVLWLGGLPRRRLNSANKNVFELTGFGADPAQPFVMSVSRAEWNGGNAGWQTSGLVDNQRTPALFKFDASRLSDVDNDGWPEYLPSLPDVGDGVPPYVYFSAGDYALHPAYPYFDASGDTNADPDDNALTTANEQIGMVRWGLAKPFASRATPPTTAVTNYNNWQVTWVQPDTFQIICAGSDGVYGARATFTGDPSPPSASQLELVQDTRVFPDAKVIAVSGATIRKPDLARGELDNLTNFTTGRLEGDIKPTGK